MINIKKIVIVFIIVLVLVGIVFGITYAKKYYAMKEIQNIAQEKAQENETSDNNAENKPTNDNDSEENGKVKTYFSDKVSEAKQYFFNEDIHIVSIGDSLTQGVGDEEKDGGYVGVLNKLINQDNTLARIDNYGKAGNRTDQMLTRLDEPEISDSLSDADIVIITIGANDIMKIFKENMLEITIDKFAEDHDNYQDRLQAIFDNIHEKNSRAQIFLVGFYNPFKNYFSDIDELEQIVNNWNDIGEGVVLDNDNTNYIPVKDLFDEAEEDIYSEDNFHPNHYGYELMAKRILENIADEGMVVYGDGKETEE